MSKIGIITYHAAYNFGSVLQAYATQQAVKKLGLPAEIINYRLKEQKRYYQQYRFSYGIKTVIKDLMQLPVHHKRLERKAAFEKFINSYLHLSKEMEEPEQVTEYYENYDIIISGSDQIWNKHSCELMHNDWKYMEPYLLKGFMGKAISYASSIANMSNDEMHRILPVIKEFEKISIRETSSARRMANLLGREIPSVLDPTFLLKKDEWIKEVNLKKTNESPYILYYSLGGIRTLRESKSALENLASKYQCKVRVVTPFAYMPNLSNLFELHPEYGPLEFLNAIYNARMIITDSYHGTIISVNFGKDVYSLCEKGGSEFRKTDILENLGLNDRIIYDINMISKHEFNDINYDIVEEKLKELRENSLKYLKESLNDL